MKKKSRDRARHTHWVQYIIDEDQPIPTDDAANNEPPGPTDVSRGGWSDGADDGPGAPDDECRFIRLMWLVGVEQEVMTVTSLIVLMLPVIQTRTIHRSNMCI